MHSSRADGPVAIRSLSILVRLDFVDLCVRHRRFNIKRTEPSIGDDDVE